MKVYLSVLILTLIMSSVFGQSHSNTIQLSKTITTERREITDFNKIDISEDFKVFIRFSGTEESVKLEANENLHDLIQVSKKGETLQISTKSYNTKSSSRKDDIKEVLVAIITMKNLIAIRGNEDVEITFEDKLIASNLSIDLEEDCTLQGEIAVQNLVANLDEDSVLDLTGSAAHMTAKASEDSMIKGLNFIVGDLRINLSGDSEAKLTVNGEIDLQANGDSFFHHRGEGKFISKHLSGDSEVKSR